MVILWLFSLPIFYIESSTIFLVLFNLIQLNMIYIIIYLVSISYITLLDSNLMGNYQRSIGSHIYGYLGIYQPILDGVKLFMKSSIVGINSLVDIYINSIIVFISLSIISLLLLNNIVYLCNSSYINMELSILVLLLLSCVNIYCILIGSYSSHNIYSLLGCFWVLCQEISYEIYLCILILILLLFYNSFSICYMVFININGNSLYILLFYIYIISLLGETNWPPFDIGESESELVSGVNTEFSSYLFSIFIIGEYLNVLLLCSICSLLFQNIGCINLYNLSNTLDILNFYNLGIYELVYNNIYNFNNIYISYMFLGLLFNIWLIVILWGIYISISQDSIIALGWLNILPMLLLYLIYIYILLMNLNIYSLT